MKKIHILLLALVVFPFYSMIGQERIDVIYLNNGDILKGVIIENVPNDYVKIELPGGSLFTVKYSDVIKFAKEKPEEPPQQQVPNQQGLPQQTALQTDNYTSEKGKISILINTGLGIPISGENFTEYYGPGLIIGGGIDFQLSSRLALQGYIDYSSFSFDDKKAENEVNDRYGDLIYDKGGNIILLSLSLNIKYLLAGADQKILPGILIGIGYSSFSFTDIEGTRYGDAFTLEGESIGGLFINFGFGINVSISQTLTFFSDIRYIHNLTNGETISATDVFDNLPRIDENGTDSKLEEDLGLVSLRVGLSYNF